MPFFTDAIKSYFGGLNLRPSRGDTTYDASTSIPQQDLSQIQNYGQQANDPYGKPIQDDRVASTNVPSYDPQVIAEGQGATNPDSSSPTAPTSSPTSGGLSTDYQSALQRATDEGRFEGLSPEERAREQIAYEKQQAGQEQDAINSAFAESEDLLNQSRGLLGTQEDLTNQAAKPYEAQLPLVNQARDEALGQLGLRKQQQETNQATALSQARSLYNEMGQGVQNRFGASSAGDFARGLQGRELQRQSGQINTTASQNIQQLQQEMQDVRDRAAAQVQNLEMQKQAAIGQAQDTFRQRLLEINNSRMALASQKAEARLNAAMELRDRIRSVQDRTEQFRQNLAAQVQAANLNLRNSLVSFQAEAQQGIGDLNLNPIPQTNFSAPGTIQQNQVGANTPTGQVNRRVEEEPSIFG